MKALSIRAPWWWMILYAGKRVENRDWRRLPTYRGTLLIHASKWHEPQEIIDTHDDLAERVAAWGAEHEQPNPTLGMYLERRGGIVGMCDLVDARWNGQHPTDPWAVPGAVGLILANVRPLPFVPFKGALGLFEVPDEVWRVAA